MTTKRHSQSAERFQPHRGGAGLSAAEIAKLLGARSTRPDRWIARCPAHADRSPSLSIRAAGDRTLLYCHAGCRTADILSAASLEWRDLFGDGAPRTRSAALPRDPVLERRDRARRELETRRQYARAGEVRLDRDPDDGLGWTLLRVAYYGLGEVEEIAGRPMEAPRRPWMTAEEISDAIEGDGP